MDNIMIKIQDEEFRLKDIENKYLEFLNTPDNDKGLKNVAEIILCLVGKIKELEGGKKSNPPKNPEVTVYGKRIIYQEASRTIRQMPDNFVIAEKGNNGRWRCDPDLAANTTISKAVFHILFDFNNRYGSGENILLKLKEYVKENKSRERAKIKL